MSACNDSGDSTFKKIATKGAVSHCHDQGAHLIEHGSYGRSERNRRPEPEFLIGTLAPGRNAAREDGRLHGAAIQHAIALIARKCGDTLPIGRDEERASLSLKAGRRNAALVEMAANTSPIAADRSDRLSQPLGSRWRQSDASRTAVPGCEHTDGPAVPDLIERRKQIADNERMTKGHVRCYRADDQAARGVQRLQLMQVTFLIDRRRIGNAQPREAERFGPLGHATRLDARRGNIMIS